MHIPKYSPRLSLSRSTSMIRVLAIFIVMQLMTACASSSKTSIIDVSKRNSSEARVSLTRMPETKDLFGQIGKAYSIDARNQFTSIQIPFEETYELGKFDPISLFIAKYSSKNKKFTALSSQVDLKTGVVKAKYNGSGIYTLFAGAILGIDDYQIEEACRLNQEIGGLDLDKIDSICPRILCANDFDNRLVVPSPLPGLFGGGNVCEKCLDSFNTQQPTICAPKPKICIPEADSPLATAELTQRGAFDPAGETCFVAGKTTLLRVAAKDVAPVSTNVDLTNVRLDIYDGGGKKCGQLKGTVTGFTYDSDNVTQLESIPHTKDVFFIVPGEALNKQAHYRFRITGTQGSNTFAGTIATQSLKRSGDITMIVVPIEDDFDPVTEFPHVLANLDDIGRNFPVRDGIHASIIPSEFNLASGVMYYMAAPISRADFQRNNGAWKSKLRVLIDDYNDTSTYDARVVAALLDNADKSAIGFPQAGQSSGRVSWSNSLGGPNSVSTSAVLTHEVAHSFGQVNPGSPNSNGGAHSKNDSFRVEGYNLLDQTRITAAETIPIMRTRTFNNRNRGFFETYEWNKLCESMSSDNYVRFQDPTPRIMANALSEKWPSSFSMIGSFDDKGGINIVRSYRTNQPRAEYVAYESDYHVVYSDSQGRELDRKPLAISQVNDSQKDENTVGSDMHSVTKPYGLGEATFSFVSAIPIKTTQVSIVKNGKELVRVDKSKHSPQINMFNVIKTKTDELIFSWNIEDKDVSSELSSSILVSKDDGESFQPVTSNRKGNTFKWHPQFLAGEVPLLFELKVTDGFHVTKHRYEQKIILNDKVPLVNIVSPQNNQTIQAHHPFVVRGIAWDVEEGKLNGDNVVWAVDGKRVSTGNIATLYGLQPGRHKLSITGIASKKQRKTFSITINVQE